MLMGRSNPMEDTVQDQVAEQMPIAEEREDMPLTESELEAIVGGDDDGDSSDSGPGSRPTGPPQDKTD